MSIDKRTFTKFIAYFPEVELPITLTSDTHHIFSRENKPLPEKLTHTMLEVDEESVDPYSEYIACFRLPPTEHYLALVYWKASLMTYQYILCTFDHSGQTLASQIIAGTKTNGDTILERVATIDEEGVIYIAEGIGKAEDRHYNADESRNYQLEILSSGDILHMMNE